MKKNVACRLFKEQLDLVKQLPKQEAMEILYVAILNAFNQFDFQFDNQTDFQNESAYVSVSDSVSDIGKSIEKLLEKNLVVKEFSNNYGGRRVGAGAKPKGSVPVPERKPFHSDKKIFSPIRPDFCPSSQTVKVLQERMLDPKLCLDFFIRECLANDYRFANYDAKMANFQYPDSCKAYNPRL